MVNNYQLRTTNYQLNNYEPRTTNYKQRTKNYQLPTVFDTCREFFTNQPFIMQNEPNLPKAQMNVNKVLIKDYEDKSNWTLGENEPKTNPICRGVASGEAGSNPILEAKKCCRV